MTVVSRSDIDTPEAIVDSYEGHEISYDTFWVHRERYRLLVILTGQEPPECEKCGKVYDYEKGNTLHFHHDDTDEGLESGIGGKNHVLAIRRQLQEDVSIIVWCQECHYIFHSDSEEKGEWKGPKP